MKTIDISDLSRPEKTALSLRAQEALRELVTKDPSIRRAELAKEIGCSRQTIANWLPAGNKSPTRKGHSSCSPRQFLPSLLAFLRKRGVRFE